MHQQVLTLERVMGSETELQRTAALTMRRRNVQTANQTGTPPPSSEHDVASVFFNLPYGPNVIVLPFYNS